MVDQARACWHRWTPGRCHDIHHWDATRELSLLFDDVDDRLGTAPDRSDPGRMTHLDFQQGETESGEDANIVTATADGSVEVVNMYANEDGTHSHDLFDWPMAIMQAEIPIWNYSDSPTDRT